MLRKGEKWARIVLMGLLNVFLIVTLIPTGYLWSYSYFPNGFPAICLFQRDAVWSYTDDYSRDPTVHPIDHDFNISFILFSVSVLVFGYVTRSWALIRRDKGSTILGTIVYDVFYVPWNQPWKYFETCIEQASSKSAVAETSAASTYFATDVRLLVLRCVYTLMIACGEVFSSLVWEVSLL
jgi:hypothetical protein